MNKSNQIFIVGSSRSGTTMMGRILNNHKEIFTLRELHFFDRIWTKYDNKKIDYNESVYILSLLLCVQSEGIFKINNFKNYEKKAINILNRYNDANSCLDIYQIFINYISQKKDSQIICDQTPNNIYYIKDILSKFSDAKVLVMIRDPRDVLLSQKNKWKRKFLGAPAIPLIELIRSYINYHPIIIGKLWSSSFSKTLDFLNDDRVKFVKFEDLVINHNTVMKEICHFLNIDFTQEMLRVPVVGSSQEEDSGKFYIDSSKAYQFRNGGVSSSEIYLSQLFSSKMMKIFSYQKDQFLFPPLGVLFHLIKFPASVFLIFVFNFRRMGNVYRNLKVRINRS